MVFQIQSVPLPTLRFVHHVGHALNAALEGEQSAAPILARIFKSTHASKLHLPRLRKLVVTALDSLEAAMEHVDVEETKTAAAEEEEEEEGATEGATMKMKIERDSSRNLLIDDDGNLKEGRGGGDFSEAHARFLRSRGALQYFEMLCFDTFWVFNMIHTVKYYPHRFPVILIPMLWWGAPVNVERN